MTQPNDQQPPVDPQQPVYPPPADPFASGPVTPPTTQMPTVPLPPNSTPTLPAPAPTSGAPVSPSYPASTPSYPATPQPPAGTSTHVPPMQATAPYPTAPPATQAYSPGYANPTSAAPYSGQPFSGQPYSGQPYPGQPVFGQQGPAPTPPKKGKGLLIGGIIAGVLLLLCVTGGVGGYLYFRNTEGIGAETAEDAADEFLRAVYKDGDATAATALTCEAARDKQKIDTKIAEVQTVKNDLKNPTVTFTTPAITEETAEGAVASSVVKLTTTDEKLSELPLKLTLVKHEGWFVCEVSKG